MKKHRHKAAPSKRFNGPVFKRIKRLFAPRSIIIISDHKTGHVPLSIGKQLAVTVGILAVVGWGSFFTGNFMAAQETLREKEKLIANSQLKNRRIEGEFALLKRDLVSMLDTEKPEDLGEYAQFVIKQYRENGNSIEDIDVDLSQLGGGKHGAMFERIAFLEQTVDEMKHSHETIIAAIEDTAQGKLAQLENIVSMSGLSLKKAEAIARAEVKDKFTEMEDGEPRGGPYDSINEDLLKSYNKPLYNNLKRLVVLDELVNFMPLDEPMHGYRLTSGFGTRIDPFKKRPANHHGLDFAGPAGSKIFSASDGVVKRAKRSGAYGLMVEIEHGADISTVYGHMSKILVESGQQIRKGQVIGIQGSTGRSTGAHLHYEVRFQGSPLNPKNFLKAGKHVRKIKEEERLQN